MVGIAGWGGGRGRSVSTARARGGTGACGARCLVLLPGAPSRAAARLRYHRPFARTALAGAPAGRAPDQPPALAAGATTAASACWLASPPVGRNALPRGSGGERGARQWACAVDLGCLSWVLSQIRGQLYQGEAPPGDGGTGRDRSRRHREARQPHRPCPPAAAPALSASGRPRSRPPCVLCTRAAPPLLPLTQPSPPPAPRPAAHQQARRRLARMQQACPARRSSGAGQVGSGTCAQLGCIYWRAAPAGMTQGAGWASRCTLSAALQPCWPPWPGFDSNV
jgi:hypothetical protein